MAVNKLKIVTSSPHIHSELSIPKIMWTVIVALLPATFVAIYQFGIDAISVIFYTVGSCVVFEALWQYLSKKEITIKDGSATLTGLLLALNLPPASPWWLCIIGGFVAIIVAKAVFGGLGQNIFNPALTARVFLLISFPALMTRWEVPKTIMPEIKSGSIPESIEFYGKLRYWSSDGTLISIQPQSQDIINKIDVVTSATPLAILKEEGAKALVNLSFWDAFLGKIPGSMGEISAFALLIGGLFLLYKRYITWHIPITFLGTMAIIATITHLIDPTKYADPLFHLVSGGAMIGAWFMATDYVTSPLYPKGQLIFGVGCGFLTMVIRLWGGYPEGVSFAILLMNATVPFIDKYTKPKKFGIKKREEVKK